MTEVVAKVMRVNHRPTIVMMALASVPVSLSRHVHNTDPSCYTGCQLAGLVHLSVACSLEQEGPISQRPMDSKVSTTVEVVLEVFAFRVIPHAYITSGSALA